MEQKNDQRRFIRFDMTENVRALDRMGHDIGRVEKVGGGGMQIRLSDAVRTDQYARGSQMEISIVEPGDVRSSFKVEVRVLEGRILGVEFLN
ncbi:MAG TPA: PilZ domain-containing protein [Terriglobales bacterium]|nr:PilZ domain-containing protein [Terriglobales bacterium]